MKKKKTIETLSLSIIPEILGKSIQSPLRYSAEVWKIRKKKEIQKVIQGLLLKTEDLNNLQFSFFYFTEVLLTEMKWYTDYSKYTCIYIKFKHFLQSYVPMTLKNFNFQQFPFISFVVVPIICSLDSLSSQMLPREGGVLQTSLF